MYVFFFNVSPKSAVFFGLLILLRNFLMFYHNLLYFRSIAASIVNVKIVNAVG